MTHQEAVLFLSDYLLGEMSGSPKDEMAAHVAACEECRTLMELRSALVGGGGGRGRGAAPGEHLSSREIAMHAVSPGRLGAADLARIEEHLAACAACSEEASISSDARDRFMAAAKREDGVEGSLAGGMGAGRVLAYLAAAAVVVLAIAGSWITIDRLQSRSEGESLRAALEGLRSHVARLEADLDRSRAERESERSWTGAVPLAVLSAPLRDEGAGAVVMIRPGQPFVPLAAAPVLPSGTRPADSFAFIIHGSDGHAVWRSEMSAREIHEQISKTRVVCFLVPSTSLASGSYELEVLPLRAPGADAILKVPFEVRPAP